MGTQHGDTAWRHSMVTVWARIVNSENAHKSQSTKRLFDCVQSVFNIQAIASRTASLLT
jgi:hypothetical protein